MNILILQASPNLRGSTAILADEFARGAREAGHKVTRVDVDRLDIAPCTGCVACGSTGMTRASQYPQKAYELGRSL